MTQPTISTDVDTLVRDFQHGLAQLSPWDRQVALWLVRTVNKPAGDRYACGPCLRSEDAR